MEELRLQQGTLTTRGKALTINGIINGDLNIEDGSEVHFDGIVRAPSNSRAAP